MEKVFLSLLVILFLLTGLSGYSQSPVEVSDPRLEMEGNIIHIYYDILNSSPGSKYSISIVIKGEDGNQFNTNALHGDIGEGVPGGSNKKISWNLEADDVFIDGYVLVQIKARLTKPPVTAIVETEETSDETVSNTYNRTGIFLQSLVLPGLGLSRVTGKPHWLRGVAGYGCIAGAIILDHQASGSYTSIDDLVNFDEINKVYDKAVQQNTVSDILGFAAAGIWIADIIWTLVGTSDLNKPSNYGESNGFSIGSKIDPLSDAPMLSFRYRF